MKRVYLAGFVALSALTALAEPASSAENNCSRSQLQMAVNAYIAAQTAGDPALMPLAPQTYYLYNMEPSSLAESIVNEALAIDFHRSLLDEATCQAYTEIVVTNAEHPYALATRLRLSGTTVTELESIVTDEGDWLFNAAAALERTSAENWYVLPENERVSRAALEAAANAYFDQFFTGPNTVYVPWGTPCNRLEGGIYSGRGTPQDTCNAGVPQGMNIVHRRFVVDEALGAVVGLVRMGPNLLPDAHLFRLENGKIRYVHTLTVCTVPQCGFGPLQPP